MKGKNIIKISQENTGEHLHVKYRQLWAHSFFCPPSEMLSQDLSLILRCTATKEYFKKRIFLDIKMDVTF